MVGPSEIKEEKASILPVGETVCTKSELAPERERNRGMRNPGPSLISCNAYKDGIGYFKSNMPVLP